MLTKTQAAAITAVTGGVMLEARFFMEEVSKKLKRHVMPEEFNNQLFRDEVRELFMDEFIDLCYQEPENKIILLGDGNG